MGAKPVRLGDSMPAGIDRSLFVEPELVHYDGPDGQSVPAWLFVPKNLDRSKKHPAIVWIHGDGINQNYDGWHVQRNYAVYYSMHQYLLQQGYVVIAPDYRGSIGYGRDWRNGVYMNVGGNDADVNDDEFERAEQTQKVMKGNVTAPFGRHVERIEDRTRNRPLWRLRGHRSLG
jgi:dipeptidyl aminopeptidase/acylaminoacyl peptidase